MADPRHHTAWHAEQLRRRRERRAYWLGIGEVYLTICLSAYTAPALAMVAGR